MQEEGGRGGYLLCLLLCNTGKDKEINDKEMMLLLQTA